MLDDVARTHGAIRAGRALSYLRSADPALIATAAQHTPLRVLAPTVAVSELPLPKLLKALREAGLQPAAEDAEGATLDLAPEPALVRPTPAALPKIQRVDEALAEQLVNTLLAEEKDASSTTAAQSPAEALQAAARARRHVRVTYFNLSLIHI